jgi:hypothetical protein
MKAPLIHGDPVSCSRVGGAMRRESSRLRQHAQSLDDALGELAAWDGPVADGAMTAIAAIADSLVALRATADDLDRAGAAVQRYATDLAEGHELGRRAELRVVAAGLLLEGTRVIEPWGPASAHEAEVRRAQVPEVQARVDLATAHVGRARGRLGREVTRLTEGFSGHSRAVRSALPGPRPNHGPALIRPSRTRRLSP